MTIMSLDIAKEHLRVTGADEDVTIALYLSAAEQAAVDFLNRGVFADTTALAAAKTAAPTALNAATVVYDEQIAGAGLLSNAVEKRFSTTAALEDYARAQDAALQAVRGMVINDAIKAAVLLTLGHLYENREQEIVARVQATSLTMGVQQLLMPHRVGLGV